MSFLKKEVRPGRFVYTQPDHFRKHFPAEKHLGEAVHDTLTKKPTVLISPTQR